MTIDLELVPDALFESEGLPRVAWEAIHAWVEERVPEPELHAAYCALARQWLERLAAHLGGDYRVRESERVLLLSPQPDRPARLFLESTTRAYGRTLEHFGPILPELHGKLALLAFADDATFYAYASPFDPEEGEFIAPGGICLNDGYVHIAFPQVHDLGELESAARHEIVHAALAFIPLPLWLDEGCAVLAEWGPPLLTAEVLEELRDCWAQHDVASFWDGSGFACPQRSQAAYELAWILVGKLLARDEAAFLRFVGRASREDAGAAAAREVYEVSLGTLVAEVLGEGDWEPRPLLAEG